MSLDHHPIDDLVRCCQAERVAFQKYHQRVSPCCTEIFRRALQGDQAAWVALDRFFDGLIHEWVRVACKFPDDFDAQTRADVVQEAKLAFFKETRNRLDLVANEDLSYVLAVWRTCTIRQVWEETRRIIRRRPFLSLQDMQVPHADHDLRIALHQRLQTFLLTDDEQLVGALFFVQHYKPSEIAQRHPERFSNVETVNKIVQRIRRRLLLDPILRDLAGLPPDKRASDDPGSDTSSDSAQPRGPITLHIEEYETEKAGLPMELPCDLPEEILFAYVAGLGSPAERAAVEARPACRARVRTIAMEVAQIEALLYRAPCPEPALLIAYHAQQLDSTPALVVFRHLESCARCREELALLATLDAIPLDTSSPLTHLRRAVEAILRPARTLQLRGESHVYETPQVLISLSLRQTASGIARWNLTGELSAADGDRFAGTVEAVVLQRQGDAVVLAEVDTDGSFVARHLAAGRYRLTITTEDEELTIKSLPIGAPDA